MITPKRFPRFCCWIFLACFLAAAAKDHNAIADDNEPPAWSIFAGDGRADQHIVVGFSNSKSFPLENVYGIEVTTDAIFFSTVGDHSIWKTDHSGSVIQRVAGTGDMGYSGDGGLAIKATFNAPHEIRADDAGNLFVADTRNHCIRRIDAATGVVETIAGDGVDGFRGDGGPGKLARFSQPHSIVLDRAGGVLVADTTNHRLRRIDLKTRIVTTVSGDGAKKLPIDGKAASSVSLHGPRSLAIDDDAIWLVLREGNSVWRIDRKSKLITRIAGTGRQGHTGDGGDPLQATFRGPKGIAVDSHGNLVVVDTENQAVRYIDRQHNRIETMAIGFKMKRPHGAGVLVRDGHPDLVLVSDSENNRVLGSEDAPSVK